MKFTHEVNEQERAQSRWDADDACYLTTEGKAWRWTSDPLTEGVEWRDNNGKGIAIAVWLTDEPRAGATRPHRQEEARC